MNVEKNDLVEHEITSSLRYAALLQQGVLPKQRHFDRIFSDAFVFYVPRQIVSGDFYWLAECDDGLIYLVVGDCTGHGVPGAMLSMLALNLLEYAILIKKLKKPDEILIEIDKRFIESFSSMELDESFDNDWADVSLCCIDKSEKKIYYSGAHRKVLLATQHEMRLLEGSPYPIGGWQLEKDRDYAPVEASYQEGDVLFLGSDGYQDQTGGPKNKKYKSMKLHRLLFDNRHLSMVEQKHILEQEFYNWKGRNQQVDDVCIVGVRL